MEMESPLGGERALNVILVTVNVLPQIRATEVTFVRSIGVSWLDRLGLKLRSFVSLRNDPGSDFKSLG